MKRLMIIPLFLFIGCGGGDETGTIQVTLNRVGDPASLISTAAGKDFPMVVNEGEVSFAAINLVDTTAGEEETPTFEGVTTFNFLAQQSIIFGPVTVVPTTFEEVHVIPGDAVAGAQVGKSLHLDLTVTLSNDAIAEVSVDLAFGVAGAEENKLAVALDVAAGDADNANININLAELLAEIDFDALAAVVGTTIAIEDGTGEPLVDAAVARVVENVLTVGFTAGNE
jgi:hypothetical protein